MVKLANMTRAWLVILVLLGASPLAHAGTLSELSVACAKMLFKAFLKPAPFFPIAGEPPVEYQDFLHRLAWREQSQMTSTLLKSTKLNDEGKKSHQLRFERRHVGEAVYVDPVTKTKVSVELVSSDLGMLYLTYRFSGGPERFEVQKQVEAVRQRLAPKSLKMLERGISQYVAVQSERKNQTQEVMTLAIEIQKLFAGWEVQQGGTVDDKLPFPISLDRSAADAGNPYKPTNMGYDEF
jgi:hypothetical protein